MPTPARTASASSRHSRRDRRRRRLHSVRALHGPRAVRAGTRLLRGRRDQARRGRRFRHGAGDDAAVRRGARDAGRGDPRGDRPRREIVELGGGSGRLAADLLDALAARGRAAVALRDPRSQPGPRASASARRSRATPRRISRASTWIDALPEAIDGAVIANEVLDAVPAAHRRAARRRRGSSAA